MPIGISITKTKLKSSQFSIDSQARARKAIVPQNKFQGVVGVPVIKFLYDYVA